MRNNEWQAQAGELFGEHWKATLANLCGVSKRQIRYWANGQESAPEWLTNAVGEMYDMWRPQD